MKDLPAQEVNEVILPLVNISRATTLGHVNPNEPHQQQLYIGSAGLVGSFAHQKTIEILVDSIFDPENNFAWGASYKIPVRYGLLSRTYVRELQSADSMSESSFAREYLSIWSSSIEGGAFSYDKMMALRKIQLAEWRGEDPDGYNDFYYVLAIDVARVGKARTVMQVLKVYPQAPKFKVNMVNSFITEGQGFLQQAIAIKQLHKLFNFKLVVIDANGLGIGLVDFLMVDNKDPHTAEVYEAWNVRNTDDYPDMAKNQTPGAPDLLHLIKTNQHNAGNIHGLAYSWLFSGRVGLLIDSGAAKEKLISSKRFEGMSAHDRTRFMQPYLNTDLLLRETANLKIGTSTVNFKLEQVESGVQKDTFSALEYGLAVIAAHEAEWLQEKRRRSGSFAQALMMN